MRKPRTKKRVKILTYSPAALLALVVLQLGLLFYITRPLALTQTPGLLELPQTGAAAITVYGPEGELLTDTTVQVDGVSRTTDNQGRLNSVLNVGNHLLTVKVNNTEYSQPILIGSDASNSKTTMAVQLETELVQNTISPLVWGVAALSVAGISIAILAKPKQRLDRQPF